MIWLLRVLALIATLGVLALPQTASADLAVDRHIVFIEGYHSSGAAEARPPPLFRAMWTSRLIPWSAQAHTLNFSYRGGTWTDGQWNPLPYGPQDTEQPLATTISELRTLIRTLRSANPRAHVEVVGFSLGGLIAVQATAEAEAENDVESMPDSVLTFSAPLGGLNVRAKQAICDNITISALLSARDAQGVDRAGLVAAAVGAQLLCPDGAVVADLQWIYDHPEWRDQRDAALQAAQAQGVRIATLANSSDCVYFATPCAGSFGARDTDDRWTTVLPFADLTETFNLAPYPSLAGVYFSHGEVLAVGSPALKAAAGFLSLPDAP